MKAIIITTYYHANLRISLARLKWLDFEFKLIVHNDHPINKLTSVDLYNYGLAEGIQFEIINQDRNLGCFDARLESIRYLIENHPEVTHFIFCDDDDTLLYPKFSDTHWVTNQQAIIVHRLKEVLGLLVPHPIVPIAPGSEWIEFEGWKMGCVGIGYSVNLWKELIPVIDKFKPTLYSWYGSTKVMEPDDGLYMHIIKLWFDYKYNTRDGFYEFVESCSYALTLLESRVGRYEVESPYDLRYGVNSNNISYPQLYNSFCDCFWGFLTSNKI